jgi:hypothetical protein
MINKSDISFNDKKQLNSKSKNTPPAKSSLFNDE